VAADNPDCWIEERPAVWRYTGELPSEVCNLVFNDGDSCGNLRYALEDLQQPGEWHYTSVGATSAGEHWKGPDPRTAVLHLCSPVNPAEAYRNIECALWGHRKLVGGGSYVVLDGLSFRNSGVHGYHAFHPHDIVIRNCDFRFIGGAVHTLDCRVRFGNGVELWDGERDVTVEHCVFDNIFDAGVTHQGGETRNIPERVYFRHNLFIDCGLAAYEFREPAQEVYFEYNTCVNSGGGFHMQGNPPPRESAISVRVRNNQLVEMIEWPTPAELETGDLTLIDVGHHVFVWRVDRGTQPGPVYIRNNVFCETPYGAAFYAVIHKEDLRHFVLDGNTYWQTTGELLTTMSGRAYRPEEFARYQADWGQDKHSKIARPTFVNENKKTMTRSAMHA
jgi:predicted outer membrane repeat protein